MELERRTIDEATRLMTEGRTAEAKYMLETLARDALNLIGMINSNINRPDDALKIMDMAVSLDPGHWATYSNYSHVLNNFDKHEKAEEVARLACILSGHNEYSPLFNMGVILSHRRKHAEAVEFYKRACQYQDNPMNRYNLACAQLTAGQFEDGWVNYDARMDAFDVTMRFRDRFSVPHWSGDPLEGKTIFVYSEQGVGDLLHFVRFVPRLVDQGARVIMEVQKGTEDVIQHSFPMIEVWGREHEEYPPPPPCDFVISVCSLARYCGVRSLDDIPGDSYLTVPDGPVPRSLDRTGFKVGICYAGNPAHTYDYLRSCPLRMFAPLGEVPGVTLYNFQVGGAGLRKWRHELLDLAAGGESVPAIDISSFLKSFSDTARCVQKMDLIVTIDSSVAHLAGAMGKPVWMLVPFVGDWRWMNGRQDTPWYPSMKIYRQETWADYGPVFRRVRDDLERLTSDQTNLGQGVTG